MRAPYLITLVAVLVGAAVYTLLGHGPLADHTPKPGPPPITAETLGRPADGPSPLATVLPRPGVLALLSAYSTIIHVESDGLRIGDPTVIRKTLLVGCSPLPRTHALTRALRRPCVSYSRMWTAAPRVQPACADASAGCVHALRALARAVDGYGSGMRAWGRIVRREVTDVKCRRALAPTHDWVVERLAVARAAHRMADAVEGRDDPAFEAARADFVDATRHMRGGTGVFALGLLNRTCAGWGLPATTPPPA